MGKVGSLLATVVLAATTLAPPCLAKAPVAPPKPPKPPLDLRVKLSETGPHDKWELRIENATSTPARVVDDLRYLWLEVKKPGQTKAKLCKLPAEMVPDGISDSRQRDLPAGGVIVRHFDPRFYCFSPDKQETLVPSAQVTPHYGFARKTKTLWRKGKKVEEFLPDVPPFVGDAVDAEGIGPVKELIGDPVILDPRYAEWAGTPGEHPDPDEDDDEPDDPTVQMVRGSDARTEMNVTAVTRVRNPMNHKLVIFLRRELITFEVMNPQGRVVRCEAEPDERNPDRRAFRTIRPGGSVSVTSRLVELCERGTFAEPGLYLVNAEFEAPADGGEFGLAAYTGTLRTPVPATVRVRKAIEIVANQPLRTGQPGAPQPGMPQPPPLQQPVQQAVPPPPPPPGP
jgi:hypothetical protein